MGRVEQVLLDDGGRVGVGVREGRPLELVLDDAIVSTELLDSWCDVKELEVAFKCEMESLGVSVKELECSIGDGVV